MACPLVKRYQTIQQPRHLTVILSYKPHSLTHSAIKMIARISTVVSVAITALSLGAQAAAVNDVSPALSNPLEARAGLCCALAVDNRILQTVCQYMYENCGGWGNCVQGNDNQWCRHCIVNHPEDEACLKLTWPPVDPAPVGKRDEIDATMAPAERDVSKET